MIQHCLWSAFFLADIVSAECCKTSHTHLVSFFGFHLKGRKLLGKLCDIYGNLPFPLLTFSPAMWPTKLQLAILDTLFEVTFSETVVGATFLARLFSIPRSKGVGRKGDFTKTVLCSILSEGLVPSSTIFLFEIHTKRSRCHFASIAARRCAAPNILLLLLFFRDVACSDEG